MMSIWFFMKPEQFDEYIDGQKSARAFAKLI